MANLKVSIVVRATDSDGYLRYYKGSFPRHVKVGRFYDEAEVAKLRLERKSKAASMGLEGSSQSRNWRTFSLPPVLL